MIQDAILRRLETLADATGKLSPGLKARHPDTRWRAIVGFRNIAAHAYLDMQADMVWKIIQVHLPALEAVVDEELNGLADGYDSFANFNFSYAAGFSTNVNAYLNVFNYYEDAISVGRNGSIYPSSPISYGDYTMYCYEC